MINGNVTRCLSTTMFDRSDVIGDDCISIDLEQREQESFGSRSWCLRLDDSMLAVTRENGVEKVR